ncbi:hypothetical protein PENTCL1PPCAC_17033, partial [Pristionchus entomophagus]
MDKLASNTGSNSNSHSVSSRARSRTVVILHVSQLNRVGEPIAILSNDRGEQASGEYRIHRVNDISHLLALGHLSHDQEVRHRSMRVVGDDSCDSVAEEHLDSIGVECTREVESRSLRPLRVRIERPDLDASQFVLLENLGRSDGLSEG